MQIHFEKQDCIFIIPILGVAKDYNGYHIYLGWLNCGIIINW